MIRDGVATELMAQLSKVMGLIAKLNMAGKFFADELKMGEKVSSACKAFVAASNVIKSKKPLRVNLHEHAVAVNAVSLFIAFVHVCTCELYIHKYKPAYSSFKYNHQCFCICMHALSYMLVYIWLETVYLMFYRSLYCKETRIIIYIMPSQLCFENK